MATQPNPFAPHWLIRDIVISAHRSAVGPGGLLFVGDSIVEGFYWNRLGSLPVLNAGYSGIWAEALEPRIPLLLKSAEPSLAVLLVGTNDAKKDCSEDGLDDAVKNLDRIISHFDEAGVPLIAMTPPPIEKAKRVTSFYSTDAIADMSRRIVETCDGRAAAIVDLQSALSDDEGAAREGMTVDGIHLSPEGYRLMHDMLAETVAAVLPERTN
ncbi:SGNH/GDSL hydrolase family protein [Microvirga sp. 2YAF29]|uniref:SGNH/GDSL hydrolase family protein n=1 Tax=Microvirga sp. 2YAF29 TaxID=3233031 RepID=UPI003F94FEC0